MAATASARGQGAARRTGGSGARSGVAIGLLRGQQQRSEEIVSGMTAGANKIEVK
ncbi:MAG TPA: hypothetical protein VFB88_03680 [Xanthobacteraceae bacterium]|nr:hypothetical protein [Xanthobacteraceae bacterium]